MGIKSAENFVVLDRNFSNVPLDFFLLWLQLPGHCSKFCACTLKRVQSSWPQQLLCDSKMMTLVDYFQKTRLNMCDSKAGGFGEH